MRCCGVPFLLFLCSLAIGVLSEDSTELTIPAAGTRPPASASDSRPKRSLTQEYGYRELLSHLMDPEHGRRRTERLRNALESMKRKQLGSPVEKEMDNILEQLKTDGPLGNDQAEAVQNPTPESESQAETLEHGDVLVDAYKASTQEARRIPVDGLYHLTAAGGFLGKGEETKKTKPIYSQT